ncbi:M15 family metallopeptidase [Aridibaculum aurantiacum]|uniref:M15 family metallopeptidase n=1 Tax=Aridibaculum aurantiacum TaxID=2810307 RepID=UPI001A95F66E|nr:M15 family metallopeptidase [Aridibaculum aurantiacum]
MYKKLVKADTSIRMVALKNFIHPLYTSLVYATPANFTKTVLYHDPEVFVRVEVARALAKVQEELKKKDLSLLFFDAYRPYSTTVKMWQVVPDERYAANPRKGSGHNRGAAVDVTLADLSNGKAVPMPTAFDDFSEKAHHNYMKLGKKVLENRKLLRTIMEKHGFRALETEWWHYSFPNAASKYHLMDLSFQQLEELTRCN